MSTLFYLSWISVWRLIIGCACNCALRSHKNLHPITHPFNRNHPHITLPAHANILCCEILQKLPIWNQGVQMYACHVIRWEEGQSCGQIEPPKNCVVWTVTIKLLAIITTSCVYVWFVNKTNRASSPPDFSADFSLFLQIIVKQSEEIHDDLDGLSEIVSWLNSSLEESQT